MILHFILVLLAVLAEGATKWPATIDARTESQWLTAHVVCTVCSATDAFGAATAGIHSFITPNAHTLAVGAPGYGLSENGAVFMVPGYTRSDYATGSSAPPSEFTAHNNTVYAHGVAQGAAFLGQPGDRFGDPIATSMDLNNDGCAELMVSMLGTGVGVDKFGGSAVIYGCGDSYDSKHGPIDFSTNANNMFVFRGGPTTLCNFGVTLYSPGDIDGDATPDLVFSAHKSALEVGAVYIVPATSATSGVEFTYDTWGGGSQGHVVSGTASTRNIGSARVMTSQWRSGKNDFNGDGEPDMTFGSVESSDDVSFGDTYVVYGPITPSMYDSLQASPESANLIVESRIQGTRGATVGVTGDLNGDGLVEMISTYSPYDTTAAAAWVHIAFGTTRLPSPFLINADLSSTWCSILMMPLKKTIASIAVVNINNDAFDDLAIVLSASNSVIVVYGHTGKWPMKLNISAMTPGTDMSYIVFSATPVDYATVASADDFNGDSIEDLVIGDPTHATVHVVFGDIQPRITTVSAPIAISDLYTVLPTALFTSVTHPLRMYMVRVSSMQDATLVYGSETSNSPITQFTTSDLAAGKVGLVRTQLDAIPTMCIYVSDGRLESTVGCLRFELGVVQTSQSLTLNFTVNNQTGTWNKTAQLLQELSMLLNVPLASLEVFSVSTNAGVVSVVINVFDNSHGLASNIANATERINAHTLDANTYVILSTAVSANTDVVRATVASSSDGPTTENKLVALWATLIAVFGVIGALSFVAVVVGLTIAYHRTKATHKNTSGQPTDVACTSTQMPAMQTINLSGSGGRSAAGRLETVPVYSAGSDGNAHYPPTTLNTVRFDPGIDCAQNTIPMMHPTNPKLH